MSAQTFAPEAPAPSTPTVSAPPPHNGRDSAGRFAKGNLGGPGNPYARHTAALRQALARAPARTKATPWDGNCISWR
jgi:hypothetical protein